MVFTVGSTQPGVQALVLTLLCLAFLLLHVFVAPMRSAGANSLQSALLVCLTALALSGTPFADAAERAVPVPGGASGSGSSGSGTSASDAMALGMQTAFGLVLPVGAVVWAVAGSHLARWLSLCRS